MGGEIWQTILVGGIPTPLKKYEFVSWQYIKSHKIPWFQTTNQNTKQSGNLLIGALSQFKAEPVQRNHMLVYKWEIVQQGKHVKHVPCWHFHDIDC